MQVYTTIEEKFCKNADHNVAVEVTRLENGTERRHCLHQAECKNEACQIYSIPKQA